VAVKTTSKPKMNPGKRRSSANTAPILHGPRPRRDLRRLSRLVRARPRALWSSIPRAASLVRELAVAADAGTAFDGKYLWQARRRPHPESRSRTGQVVATIPAPMPRLGPDLGRGDTLGRRVPRPQDHQIDAETGAILRTIESESLRHRRLLGQRRALARHLEADRSDLRRINPETGEVLERLEMPAGAP